MNIKVLAQKRNRAFEMGAFAGVLVIHGSPILAAGMGESQRKHGPLAVIDAVKGAWLGLFWNQPLPVSPDLLMEPIGIEIGSVGPSEDTQLDFDLLK